MTTVLQADAHSTTSETSALEELARALSDIPEVEVVVWIDAKPTIEQKVPTHKGTLAILCPKADIYVWDRIQQVAEFADALWPMRITRLQKASEVLTATVDQEGKLLFVRRIS